MTVKTTLKKVVRRVIGRDKYETWRKGITRDVTAVATRLGTGGVTNSYDAKTPRRPILTKRDRPLMSPQGDGWMAGAVYDARPIHFMNRRLVYFCAQPAYRTDSHLFVGLAEFNGNDLRIEPEPVIVPDEERRGIDIPAFTVFRDRVIGLYADDFGPKKTGLGTDANFILAESSDGSTFTKRAIPAPLRESHFARIGLPWLLADGDTIKLYMRAKRDGRNFLTLSTLDVSSATISPPEVACEFQRNPINVAVTKRGKNYLLFSGATIGGGLYCAPSPDGRAFDFDREQMIVSRQSEWGWDFYKVGGSPDNTTNDVVEICFTGGLKPGPSVGYGTFSTADL